MTAGFVLATLLSVPLSAALVVQAARRLPRPPVVELAIVGILVATLLILGFAESGATMPAWLVPASLLAWLVLLYTYPDGRVAPPWLVASLVVASLVIVAQPALGLDEAIVLPAFGIGFAIGAWGQVWRYRRRSSVRERQATKWVLAGLIPAVSVFLGIGLIASTTFLGESVMEESWYELLSTAAIWVVPWCAAIGIIAPERGNLDASIHLLIVLCGSAIALAWLYFLAVAPLGPHWAAALTVISVLPVVWLTRRAATWAVYQRSPARALVTLGGRLEQSIGPDEVAAVVAQTVVDGLAVPYVAVTLETELAAEVGERGGASLEDFPVEYHGEDVATISVAPRRGDLALAARDREVLGRLVSSAGAALHGAVALRRLQAAREQLVRAREEERRRLRRDLHDDLAPTLASLGLRAAAASALLERDPDRARELQAVLQTDITEAVGKVRELAYDLRPPILDDLGLEAAIRERLATDADPGLEIEVRADVDDAMLPAAVQLAALRIVGEAVTNVRKHASAGRCIIGLTQDSAWLEVRVTDDGRGLSSDFTPGIGLGSIQERAAELGGVASITSDASGTSVVARLPLMQSPA